MGNSCAQIEPCNRILQNQCQNYQVELENKNLENCINKQYQLINENQLCIPIECEISTTAQFSIQRTQQDKRQVIVKNTYFSIFSGNYKEIGPCIYNKVYKGIKQTFICKLSQGEFIILIQFKFEVLNSESQRDREGAQILGIGQQNFNFEKKKKNQTLIGNNNRENEELNASNQKQSQDGSNISKNRRDEQPTTQLTDKNTEIKEESNNNLGMKNENGQYNFSTGLPQRITEQLNEENSQSIRSDKQGEKDEIKQVQNQLQLLDLEEKEKEQQIKQQLCFNFSFEILQYPEGRIQFKKQFTDIGQIVQVASDYLMKIKRYHSYMFQKINMKNQANTVIPIKIQKLEQQQNFDNLDYNQKIIFYPAEKNKVESLKVYVFQGKVEGQKKLGKIIYKNTEDKAHLGMDLELEPGDYTMWEKVINKVDYEIHGLSQNCNIQIYTELINCYHDFGGL